MWSKAPKSRTKTLREAWNTKTKELLEWATNAMELLSVPPSMTISAFRTRWFIALTMITTLFLPTAMLSIVETKVELFGLTRLEWRIEVTRRSREKTSSKSKVGILRLARLCSLTNAWLGLSIQSTHHKELISLGKIFSSDFSNWWESIKLGLDGLHLTNKFRNSHALLTKVD